MELREIPVSQYFLAELPADQLHARNFLVAPTSRRATHRSRARFRQVGHNRARVLGLESHSASTRSNSNDCEHEGGRRNNTTSIPLQRLPPAVSRTTRYDTGCS